MVTPCSADLAVEVRGFECREWLLTKILKPQTLKARVCATSGDFLPWQVRDANRLFLVTRPPDAG